MAKDSLFCNYWSYIASGTGSQAEQTFGVLEKLANDNIDTFSGSTGKIFKDEIVINNASGDGFSHNPNGFNFKTYNGSSTTTLNSNIDSRRGIFFVVFTTKSRLFDYLKLRRKEYDTTSKRIY